MTGEEVDRARRERLLGDVVRRVRTYTGGGSADGVLDPEAVEETARLVEFLRGRDDPECHYWIGMLHFYRWATMPSGVEGMRERRTAALHLVPVMASHPGVVDDVVARAMRPIGDTADSWTDIALDLFDQFARTGETALADVAVDYLEFAARVRQGMPDEGMRWRNALVGAYNRHRRTNDPEHLPSLVRAGRKAAQLAAPDDPELGTVLSITSQALLDTEDITHEPAILDEALAVAERSVRITPPGDPNRHSVLLNLANALDRRHARTGDAAALDRAVEVARACVAETGDPDGGIAALAVLGQALTRRGEHDGGPADLEEAVTVLRQAWHAVPPGDGNALAVCSSLAAALVASFEANSDPATLAEAAGLRRRAVELSAGDPALHLGTLTNLALVLLEQAHYDGHAPETVAEAVALARAAAAATAPGGVNRYEAHSALANALQASWEYEGHLGLLDESITIYRTLLAELPENSGNVRQILRHLAGGLTNRYRATGDSTALLEALHAGRRLLELTPPGHFFRPRAAFQVAATLQEMADRRDDNEPLIEAIGLYREAADALPAGHAELPSGLNTLAGALRQLAQRTGEDGPLDEAIALFRRAVDELATARHVRSAYMGVYRNNLAVALRIRYERAGRWADLEEAVTLLREAAAAVPSGRHRRASRLSNLAFALRQLAAAAPDADPATGGAAASQSREAALREAEAAYREAAATTAAPPLERVQDARNLGVLLAGAGRWPAARDAFQLAVDLLPMTARRGLPRRDQEYGLSRHIGLAADAAACALMTGDPVRALRTLEQGRGILLAQTIETRSDMSELRERQPELAAELTELIEALQGQQAGRASRAGMGDLQPTSVTLDRAAAAAAWEDLLARIRTLPGFADFLGVPATDTLLAAAAEGPVVVVNVSAYRSDALIVTPGGITAVPLPAATPDAVAEEVRALRDAVETASTPGRDGPAAESAVHAVLRWLWDAVAGPVLDRLTELGHLTPERPAPRLWWSPTGQMAFLPLHAAGHHTGAGAGAGPARTVPDRVVSSYAPTIRTLLHVRAQAAAPATTDRMLVVAMPHTPGATDLQGAENEARALAVYRPTVLSGPAATHEAVRDAMAEATCVHFACHAVSEPTDPSLSRLLVHDHADHPLTVADISRLRLPGARLAYLSACDTARTAVHLADEAVHIATAFQLAGFPHVVGTLWRANDTFAARLAAEFHATLPGHSPAHCAYALHRCLLEARAAYPVTPSLWAPYLHTGA